VKKKIGLHFRLSDSGLVMRKLQLVPLELVQFHRSVDSFPEYKKVAVDTICRKLGLVGGRKRTRVKTCLELGAGTGNLTAKLLELAQGNFELTAIERDAALRSSLLRSTTGPFYQESGGLANSDLSDLSDFEAVFGKKNTGEHHTEDGHDKSDQQQQERPERPIIRAGMGRRGATSAAELTILPTIPALHDPEMNRCQYDAIVAGGGFRWLMEEPGSFAQVKALLKEDGTFGVLCNTIDSRSEGHWVNELEKLLAPGELLRINPVHAFIWRMLIVDCSRSVALFPGRGCVHRVRTPPPPVLPPCRAPAAWSKWLDGALNQQDVNGGRQGYPRMGLAAEGAKKKY
jgi:SAM-dependent methyltransferase